MVEIGNGPFQEKTIPLYPLGHFQYDAENCLAVLIIDFVKKLH